MNHRSSLMTTLIACRHQAAAPFIAAYTALSCARGLNRSTLYDASCTPRLCDTRDRNLSRFRRGIVSRCACTSASIMMNSGDGSGRSGTGASGMPKVHANVLTKAAIGNGYFHRELNRSHPLHIGGVG